MPQFFFWESFDGNQFCLDEVYIKLQQQQTGVVDFNIYISVSSHLFNFWVLYRNSLIVIPIDIYHISSRCATVQGNICLWKAHLGSTLFDNFSMSCNSISFISFEWFLTMFRYVKIYSYYGLLIHDVSTWTINVPLTFFFSVGIQLACVNFMFKFLCFFLFLLYKQIIYFNHSIVTFI